MAVLSLAIIIGLITGVMQCVKWWYVTKKGKQALQLEEVEERCEEL